MPRYLIAVDLLESDLARAYPEDTAISGSAFDDLIVSIGARLNEVYCGRHNEPVRANVVAVCDVTAVLREFMDATEVGADGIEDVDKRGHVLGSLVTFTQQLDNHWTEL